MHGRPLAQGHKSITDVLCYHTYWEVMPSFILNKQWKAEHHGMSARCSVIIKFVAAQASSGMMTSTLTSFIPERL